MSFVRWERIEGTRRDVLALGAALAGAAALPVGRATAQDATPGASPEASPAAGGGPQVDSAFSNEILPTLGLQTIDLTISADGISGAPLEAKAGNLLVNWTTEGVVGYLLFAQAPFGLTNEEELEQVRQAGSFDLQQAGWVYGGGTNADPDTTVQVVVSLTPGDWTIYASHMDPAGNFETDEIYTLSRLTVSEDTSAVASPAASPMIDLPVDVTVEMLDAAYVMDTVSVGTGPKIWAFPNTGMTEAHHVVMVRTTEPIDAADMTELVDAFSSGTGAPPAWFQEITFAGYTALVSPGYVSYSEFDLEPGTYLLLCFILGTETGAPHFADGMWAPFTVE